MPIDPAWRRWGPYLAERAWGTVREDYSADGDAWEYLPHDHARSRAYRWNEDGLGGHLRRPPAALLRLRVLERRRPDPEGADLRPHGQRGQPRRGRQGVLVVPRLHADALLDALALPVPAARVPVRRPGRRERAPRPAGARVRAARHRRLRRRPLLGHHRRLREGGARTTSASGCRSATPGRTRPRSTCCRRSGSATRGPGAATTASPCSSATDGRIVAEHHDLGRMVLTGDGRPTALFCENETNAAPPVGRPTGPTAYPKDGIGDHVVARRRHGQPGDSRDEGGALVPARPSRAGRDRRAPAAPRARRRGDLDAGFDGDDGRRASARPTSSTPS